MGALEELDRLRQEVDAVRARMEAVSGTVERLGRLGSPPDGTGERPAVLPPVADIPIGQDTNLLHMAVKPYLRKRLGAKTNAAQVLLDVVERDSAGRERSWAFLPSPLPVAPGAFEGPESVACLDALGNATNRNLLNVLWEGEQSVLALAARARVDERTVREHLATLQALGWLAELPNDRYLLSEQGRRAAVCAWAIASALSRPR